MKRDIITINDLTTNEIEDIFDLADEFLRGMSSPEEPYKVRGNAALAQSFVLATLFYEPSTRTRLSFESAMARLGGATISAADPAATSAAKGESLADTIRVVENYADLIVLRHPCEGAARAAAEYTGVPVINGGDGSHEHPTQTLCDLYTLRRENKNLRGLNVLLIGDLKNGRTIHSLVYALARFGANIIPLPAKGLELPEHVTRRLGREYNCIPVHKDELDRINDDETQIDVVYVTPVRPHQLALLMTNNVVAFEQAKKMAKQTLKRIDVCYVTRRQSERTASVDVADDKYPTVDTKFLEGKQYAETRVLHPLPRVDELGYDLDKDERGVYFKQAAYGVPVRMALMAKLLGIKPFKRSEEERYRERLKTYSSANGMRCPNPNCITNHERERKKLRATFFIICDDNMLKARCVYCENEKQPGCVGSEATKTYTTNTSIDALAEQNGLAIFEDVEQARAAGFHENAGEQRKQA